MGAYVFVEEEEFSLVKSSNDFGLIPDIVQIFCRVKKMMSQTIADLVKKRKTEAPFSSVSLEHQIKQTVVLPIKCCLVLAHNKFFFCNNSDTCSGFSEDFGFVIECYNPL
ncbi:hypothetical protein BD560DRAFT_422338 [Blakeslea trispora]|nr:hypothetical protein BD560DRAFT_422338 [Blakeslea trispora]